MRQRFFAFILIVLLSLSPAVTYGFEHATSYDQNRIQLLGYLLKQYLGTGSFSQKKIDDALSQAAFTLYLKQLDPQKRFLLKQDVETLRAYADKIDNEITTGEIGLPEAAAALMDARIAQVQQMGKELLSKNFDFTKLEFIETDIDKLDYCATEGELKERWRKLLKYQVLSRYLGLIDEKNSKEDTATQERTGTPELQNLAREKVLRSNEELFHRIQHEKPSERYDRYFSAIAKAFDPHTGYLPPSDKEDFDISMKGSLEGIGAVLREEDGYIRIENLTPGGPASRQGQLHVGDVILKVGEGDKEPVDITDMKLKDAIRLIRGKRGTEVRLTVQRHGTARLTVPLTRDVIQIEETFAKGVAIKDGQSGKTFGYIKLPSFYRDFKSFSTKGKGRNSTDDLKAELKKLEAYQISGLVLDLRNNGGGALNDAVDIAGLFIKEGPVVQVKDRTGKVTTLYDRDPAVYYKGPLIILVNRLSASASEILAGALQDYGRAIIVGGERTYGKGTVQIMVDLSENVPALFSQYKPLGALMLTIQKFYRISGESTQYRGVIPDITLPDPLKGFKIGEQYLEYALPWDTIAPASYVKVQPQLDISSFKLKSSLRSQSNQDFITIAKESVLISELKDQTLQPLDIDALRKERESAAKLKAGKALSSQVDLEADEPLSKDSSKVKSLADEAKKDPYVKESIAVLKDIIAASKPELVLK